MVKYVYGLFGAIDYRLCCVEELSSNGKTRVKDVFVTLILAFFFLNFHGISSYHYQRNQYLAQK